LSDFSLCDEGIRNIFSTEPHENTRDAEDIAETICLPVIHGGTLFSLLYYIPASRSMFFCIMRGKKVPAFFPQEMFPLGEKL